LRVFAPHADLAPLAWTTASTGLWTMTERMLRGAGEFLGVPRLLRPAGAPHELPAAQPARSRQLQRPGRCVRVRLAYKGKSGSWVRAAKVLRDFVRWGTCTNGPLPPPTSKYAPEACRCQEVSGMANHQESRSRRSSRSTLVCRGWRHATSLSPAFVLCLS